MSEKLKQDDGAAVAAPRGRHKFFSLEVSFGPGSVSTLRDEAKRLGATRAFIITGNTIATQTSLVERCQEALGDRFAGVFSGTGEHVPRESVLAGAAAAREYGADMIVSLGGGSPADAAKIIALCLAAGVTSSEELDDYRIPYRAGDPPVKRTAPRDPPPIVAVPTTLSAAEFNGSGGATDTVGNKDAFGGPHYTPRTIVLDPEMTLDTPMWLWGSTGMRALDHAVETVYSRDHHPFADALGLHASGELVSSLDQCRLDPEDIAARGRCQIAAWMSIAPFSSVKTGLSHEVTLHLGAQCHIPHGVTSAIVLPEAMAFNLPASADRQAMLAEAMGVREAGMDDEAAGAAAAERLRQLVRDLGIKNRLRDWGVTEEQLASVAAAARVPAANPRPVESPDEIVAMLRAVM
jgi:alcohol dehydrogenase